MSGYGVNPPSGRLTGQQGFQPATVAHTVVTVQMPGNQRVLYVLPGYQVVNMMPPSPLTGYPPSIGLPSHTVAPTPARHHYYQQLASQWQRPATVSPSLIAERQVSERSVDEAYRHLRQCNNDRLASLVDWEWEELARILKPGMESCGYHLDDEQAVVDELKSLCQSNNIGTFEALEKAVIERAFSQETEVKQPLAASRPVAEVIVDNREESTETVSVGSDPVIAAPDRESVLSENQPEPARLAPAADGNLSATDNRDDEYSSRVPETPSTVDARQPTGKRSVPPSWWLRKTASVVVKRLKQGWRKKGDTGTAASHHPVLSVKKFRLANVDILTVPMEYRQLKVLSDSVVTCWNFYATLYGHYKECVDELKVLAQDRQLSASERDDIRESLQEQIAELGPQLKDAVIDIRKALKIYKSTEKKVQHISLKGENEPFNLDNIQSPVRRVAMSLEKVQKAIKKMR